MRVYNFSGGIWWNLYWQCCHPSTICRRASAGWGSIKVFNRLVEIWLRCSLWEENWGIFGELTTFNSICGESKTSYKTFPENWQHPAQPLQDLSRKQQKHFTVGQGWQDINGMQLEPLNSNIGKKKITISTYCEEIGSHCNLFCKSVARLALWKALNPK